MVGRPAIPTRPRSPTRSSILVQEPLPQTNFSGPDFTSGGEGQQSNNIFDKQLIQDNGTTGTQGVQTHGVFDSPNTQSNGIFGGQSIYNGTYGMQVSHNTFGVQGTQVTQGASAYSDQSNSLVPPTQPISSRASSTLVRQPIPSPGRQPIVTNMTPDDPTKPWIPAHLQQKSAKEALMEIAGMVGLCKCYWVISCIALLTLLAFQEVTGYGGALGSRPQAASHDGMILFDSPNRLRTLLIYLDIYSHYPSYRQLYTEL